METAEDGATGLARFDPELHDLVITDMEMPGIDGIELVRRIRSNKKTEDLVVVMISAQSSDEAVDRGFEAGVNAYLTKDRLNSPTLRRTLKNLFAT